MRLVSCKIENFGKLHDFTYTFSEGLNLIHEKNGWGKSTLAAFIRIMLYGFEGDKKRDNLENERRRYAPWQQGTFGGELVLWTNGKQISIRRNFGKKAADDTLLVTDLETGLPYTELGEVPGLGLFEIDSASFTKTAFVSQNDCSSETTGTIYAKLGNLVECMDDINRYETVDEVLKKYLDNNSATRVTGTLSKGQKRLTELQARIREENGSEEGLQQIREKREEAEQKKAHLQEQGSRLRKLRIELSNYQEDKGKLDKCLELEEEATRRKEQEKESRDFFPKELPADEMIEEYMKKAVRANGLTEMMDHLKLQDEEIRRLSALENKYMDFEDVDHQIDECYSLCEERNEAVEQVAKARENRNRYLEQNQTETVSSIGVKILLAVIVMIAGAAIGVLFHILVGTLILMAGMGILGFVLVKGRVDQKEQQEILAEQQTLEVALQDSDAHLKELEERLKDAFASLNVQSREESIGENPYQFLSKIENELKEYRELINKQESYLRKKADVDRMEESVRAYISSLGFTPMENLHAQLEQMRMQLKDLDGKVKETGIAEEKRDAYGPYKEIERLRKLQRPDTDKDMEALAAEEEEIEKNLHEVMEQLKVYDREEQVLGERYDNWLKDCCELEQLSQEIEEGRKKYDLIKKTREFLGQAKNSMTAKYTAPIMKGFQNYYQLLTGEDSDAFQMDATTKLSIVEYNMPREIASQSMGIRDLIGVCFRMGLIGAMYTNEKPFVIMDDPFVNLDDERNKRVADFITQMTKDYQVIYFTCHEPFSCK